jgi:hypothetical protein
MTVPPDLVMGLLGSADGNLRALEASLSAELHVRGNTVNLSGSAADVALAEQVIAELIAVVAGGSTPTTATSDPRAVGRLVSSAITVRTAFGQPSWPRSSRPRASDRSRRSARSASRPIASAIAAGSCGSHVSSGITSSLMEEPLEPITGTPQP